MLSKLCFWAPLDECKKLNCWWKPIKIESLKSYLSNHEVTEISVFWLVERSAIKLLILHVAKEK